MAENRFAKYAQPSASSSGGGYTIGTPDPYKARNEARKDEDQQLQRESAARADAAARRAAEAANRQAAAAERAAGAQEVTANNTGFNQTLKLRSDYDGMPGVKEYRVAISQLAQGLRTGADAAGDNALIYAYAKVMDPGSVVRESEMQMAGSTGSWLESTAAQLKKQFGIDGGGQLSPEVRAKLRREMLGKTTELNRAYNLQRDRYATDARALGVDPERVIGKHDGQPFLSDIEQAGVKDPRIIGAIGADHSKPIPRIGGGTAPDGGGPRYEATQDPDGGLNIFPVDDDPRPTSFGQGVAEGIAPAARNMGNLADTINPAMWGAKAIADALGYKVPTAGDVYNANNQAFEASPEQGSTWGKVAGGIGASLPLLALPGGPMAQGAMGGALLSDANSVGGFARDTALGGVLGKAGGALGTGLAGTFGKRAADPLLAGERNVVDAVNKTGQDSVVSALRQAQELGVPAALADVAPEVGSLTGAALRRSPTAAGNARDVLATRGRGQYDRFRGAVERDLGPIENVPQRSEDLIAQARTAAAPLYDAAYAAPGAGAVYPSIESLLARPSMRGALGRARNIAAEEGRDPTALGFTLDQEGNTVLQQVPSWQTLDYTKRGMDDVLEGFRDGTTGRLNLDEHGRAIDATRREFLGTVDNINPAYADARAAYAGPAQERDALRAGQQAVTMSPDQLGVNLGRATEPQRQQMQLGFQSQLAENAGRGRTSSNPFEATLGTPNMEQRLTSLYGDTPGVARLLAQRDLERQVAGSTNRLIGNSMTAERLVADDAFNQSGMIGDVAQGALETAITGAPVATVMRSGVGRGVGNAVRDWRALGVGKKGVERADQIADLALNTDPEATIARLLALSEQSAEYKAVLEALKKSPIVRGGSLGVAGAAGGARAN